MVLKIYINFIENIAQVTIERLYQERMKDIKKGVAEGRERRGRGGEGRDGDNIFVKYGVS